MKRNLRKHRIKATIGCEYTRTAASYIKDGVLTNYTTDETFIYKLIDNESYLNMVISGKLTMDELGIEAEYDINYKQDE